MSTKAVFFLGVLRTDLMSVKTFAMFFKETVFCLSDEKRNFFLHT